MKKTFITIDGTATVEVVIGTWTRGAGKLDVRGGGAVEVDDGSGLTVTAGGEAIVGGGTEVYERLPVILEAKNVSGDEKGSVWRFTMPWSALKGMKPEAGAHVACNVICDCVPIGRTDRVRYALANDEPETHNENFRNKCVMLELK